MKSRREKMPKAIPTAGYRSQRAAVAALIGEGKSVEAIQELTGVSRKHIQNIQSDIKKRNPARTTLHLGPAQMKALSGPAAERGISSVALAARILSVAIADDMIDAILDDRSEPKADAPRAFAQAAAR